MPCLAQKLHVNTACYKKITKYDFEIIKKSCNFVVKLRKK